MMPVSTQWFDNEHRILEQRFEGDWLWEEANDALVEAHVLAASVTHNIILICDMSLTTALPKGNVLSPARSSLGQVPANITQIIFVIQSRLIEVFASLVLEMVPRWKQHTQIVKTRDEAQKLAQAAITKQNRGTFQG
ncbi:MAG: hypothetical protein H0X30_20085 [Anaerolineae bacterium]|nr:hypothetical protein [Anaerolineae bacterium]